MRPADGAALVTRGLDVWEIDRDRAIVLGSAADEAALRTAGFDVGLVRRFAEGRRAAAATFGPGGYKGYDAVVAELRAVAAAHPSIVTLHDLGPSWEATKGRADRRVWAARVSNGPSAKPAALYLGAYHAREVVTPDLALRLLTTLVADYGRDPLLTRLVNTLELWVVPVVNPDGYARVEAGAEWWRKNADDAQGVCIAAEGYTLGVDLNRNHPYAWNASGGASTDPCAETYRGPEAASEPETQAVQGLLRSVDARALISWHSYGNLVLWPPTSTADPRGADPVLDALGARLARLTGYRGGAGGAALYLTSGELTEWAWFDRGAAAFTIEVGGYQDGLGGNPFAPPYRTVERFWHENKAAALYLARVTDRPARAAAPDVELLRVGLPFGAATAEVRATLSSGEGGPAALAELFVDAPGAEGTGVPGRVSGTTATWSVPTLGLAPGRHAVWARARATAGEWGPLQATSVLVGRQSLVFPALARAAGIGS